MTTSAHFESIENLVSGFSWYEPRIFQLAQDVAAAEQTARPQQDEIAGLNKKLRLLDDLRPLMLPGDKYRVDRLAERLESLQGTVGSALRDTLAYSPEAPAARKARQ